MILYYSMENENFSLVDDNHTINNTNTKDRKLSRSQVKPTDKRCAMNCWAVITKFSHKVLKEGKGQWQIKQHANLKRKCVIIGGQIKKKEVIFD